MSSLPTIFVILGVTGDLAATKLLPALFRLYKKGELPRMFQVVGFSRRDLTEEEFRSYVLGILKNEGSRKEREAFVSSMRYVRGVFEEREGYDGVAKVLGRQDEEWRVCANKLFYLAVPPSSYEVIFKNLAASGLTEPCSPEEGWTRVIVEKPFGRDLKTAQKLDRMLGTLFEEEQVYRIDHYLGKETVQNVMAFRFSNSFWEPAWNADSVERIEVRLLEKGGIGSRGEFYEGIGALRDVGQNHLLQLLALFTMDNPGTFDAESIRKKRAEALSQLKIQDMKTGTRRAQYVGYRKEHRVSKDSETETYFSLTAFLDSPRWRGVPILLESGKAVGENRVEAVVTFRHEEPCLCPSGQHYKNRLHYHVQPNEKIFTSFWVKKPGAEMRLEEKSFAFDYKEAYGKEIADAYEKLLLAAVSGDQTLFVSTDEILASWKFIDPILRFWQKGGVPLEFYPRGSGPAPEESKAPAVKKELGYVGLGKMGSAMVLRLTSRGWRVLVTDLDKKAVKDQARHPLVQGYESIEDMAASLARPRVVWVMVPAGRAVDRVVKELGEALEKGDVVVDGGNSFFEETVRRAKELKTKGVVLLDAGVSGGPETVERGRPAVMVGGDKRTFEQLLPLFSDITRTQSFGYMGASGAGHFVKMVHNGIEYGAMQSLAEGFTVLRESSFAIDLKEAARVYNNGSVIESRLLGWLLSGFEAFGEGLRGVSGSVAHTGEGRWTVQTAKKLGVEVPAIAAAFAFRLRSARHPSFTGKILMALRNRFGGHKVK